MELYLGDCLEIMPQLQPNSVDCVIADLPYGTTACPWDSIIPLEPLWNMYKLLLKGNQGYILLFGSQPFSSILVVSNIAWFRYELIWEKDRPSGSLLAKRRPLKAHENILVFGNGIYNPQMVKSDKPINKPGRNSKNAAVYAKTPWKWNGDSGYRYPRSVQKFNTPNSAHGILHPTQKPLALIEYLVKTYTNPGDTVLDNVMGSGTTGEACVNTGRNFVGIEKDEGYFNIAVKRIQQARLNVLKQRCNGA